MQSKTLGWLQAYLWFICAFQIVVGAGLNLFPDFPKLMAELYGAEAQWTAQFSYILKPLGAFMLALGIMAAIAARNPLANGAVIYGFTALFAIRGLQRIVYQNEIQDVFSIAVERNLVAAAIFLFMEGILVMLYRKSVTHK